MSNFQLYKKAISATGTTTENEPVVKSDGASSDVMEWAASTGSSSIKIRENSANDLVLDVEGNLELADRVASITSSTDVGAVFLYDTKNTDSDGGAWRKKCKGLSWFDEGSSTTRSARSEFPAMSLIVVDNVSSAATVSIYDLDDVAAPLWLKLNAGTSSLIGASSAVYSSVTMLNGVMVLGRTTNGVYLLDFASESATFYNNSNGKYVYNGGFVNRNGSVTYQSLGTSAGQLANDAVNDIAATILEGAEIGALGLPIPTVAVATAGGISVILPSGTVNNSASTDAITTVVFGPNGRLWRWRNPSSGSTWGTFVEQAAYFSASFATGEYFSQTTHGSASSYIPNYLGDGTIVAQTGGNNIAVGTDEALNRYLFNPSDKSESAVAYIDSQMNTGYQVGDIRGAWLCDSKTSDRSVKANTLTQNGTVSNSSKVATGADLIAYSDFSSLNYLSLAYTADLNFTNTMSVMFWVKDYGNSSDIYGIGTRGSTLSQSLYIDGGYDYRWTLTSNGSTEQQFEIPEDGVLGEWTFVCFTMNAGAVRGYKNGVNIADSNGTFTGNIFSQATDTEGLEIGKGPIASGGSSGGKLSLFRISATAPTPKQIADIYAAEKPLFAEDAKCLAGNNTIYDLAYDKSADLLYVAHASRAQVFRGLESIQSLSRDSKYAFSSDGRLDLIAAAGGVHAASRTALGVGVNLPSIDVRAELNEGESKIPDDGKFHFNAAIEGSTPTVIGNIYVDEGDTVLVRAKIVGQAYQDQGGWRTTSITEQSFSRDVGGDITARTASYVLRDEAHADFDSVLQATTANDCIELKVTGKTGVRMVWNAEVEVVRGSDTGKTYER